jgi:uncharacterized SAM-binding protein YcdF (DUF218 family)
MRIRRFRRLAWIFLLAVLIRDLISFATEIQKPGNSTDKTVDLVAVLTGGQGRLKEAFSVFSLRRGQYLLISGVAETSDLDDLLRANSNPPMADELRGRVIIDTESLSTLDNVRFILKVLKDKDLRSVRIITSNYHLPRTLKLFEREHEKIMKDTEIRMESVGVESPNFPNTGWWSNWTSWKILLSEYFKSRVGA